MRNLKIIGAIALAATMVACSPDEEVTPNNNSSTRYSSETFSSVDVDSVQYDASNDLWMNIYTPSGDNATNRRVVLLAHGGAFVNGSRNNPLMIDYATRLAKYGYVAISYDYRKATEWTMMLDSVTSLGIVAKALADGNTVLSSVIASHASGNPYGIDPTRVALAGNSAGAVLSLHMGHFDQDDNASANLQVAIDSAGGWSVMWNPSGPNQVKAIVALAGGMVDASWLNADGPELIMAHGTWDNIVPYGCGHVLNGVTTAMILCGTETLKVEASGISLESSTLIYPELQHCPWNSDPNMANEVFDFIIPELKAAMD